MTNAQSRHSLECSYGVFDLEVATLKSLVATYASQIHTLYPFIPKADLERFGADLATKPTDLEPSLLRSVTGAGVSSGTKRKRVFITSSDNPHAASTAVLSLVLALGKVCQYRASISASSTSDCRLPGFAYFSYADAILDSQVDRSLPYVEANLLACLYMALIGRPLDGHRWLQRACQACLALRSRYVSCPHV